MFSYFRFIILVSLLVLWTVFFRRLRKLLKVINSVNLAWQNLVIVENDSVNLEAVMQLFWKEKIRENSNGEGNFSFIVVL